MIQICPAGCLRRLDVSHRQMSRRRLYLFHRGFLQYASQKSGLGSVKGALLKTKEKPIPAVQRRALALLAWSGQDGMTEALLVHGHKVQVEVLVELVNAGLVVASVEKLARPAIEVA